MTNVSRRWQRFYDIFPLLHTGTCISWSFDVLASGRDKLTAWFASRKSSWLFAMCRRYLPSLPSSRSAMPTGVRAFLNAEILRPSLGLSAKFLPYLERQEKFTTQTMSSCRCRENGDQ